MRRPRPTRGLSRQEKKISTHTRLHNLLYSNYIMNFNQLVCHTFGVINEYLTSEPETIYRGFSWHLLLTEFLNDVSIHSEFC
jgi:hypothetical protein